MKKYLFAILMAVGVLTSCTNDDIEVNVVEENKTTFTYSVETQSVYDKFNATSELKSRFLSGDAGSYYLGVYTYIYDTDGQLVDSKISYNKTFGEESTQFTLNDGTYTAVTVEMVVDKDNKYESETFELVGTEKLSTIEIAFKKDSEGEYASTASWWQCIGTSITDINVNSSTHEIKITPKPIGFVLEYNAPNYEKGNYQGMVVWTKDAPIGRYLDPSKTGNNRFHYDKYNSGSDVTERAISLFQSGSGNNFGAYLIEEGDVRLSLGPIDEDYSGWFKTNKYKNGLRDGGYYYGGLYYLGDTEIKWDFGVFETISERKSWYDEMEKLYNSNHTSSFSLVTPYMTWNAKVSNVHSSMTGTKQTVGTSTTAVYNSTTGSYYTEYQGMDVATAIQYYFTSSSTGLVESDVFYDAKKYSFDTINAELAKKYDFLSATDNGTYGYVTKDYNTMILLMPGTYNMVGYIDVSYVLGSKQTIFNQVADAKHSAPVLQSITPTIQKSKIATPFLLNKNNCNSRVSSIIR